MKQCKTFNCKCNCKDCNRMRGYKMLGGEKDYNNNTCNAVIRKGNKEHKE